MAYPDQYFYNLDGQVLIFVFEGPYLNDKTPSAATKRLEWKMLASFRRTEPKTQVRMRGREALQISNAFRSAT